jgi:probable HAF family extracellular repeat protein
MGSPLRSPDAPRPSRRLALAWLGILLFGCAEDVRTPLAPEEFHGPLTSISDGARGGNEHFYFLPPLVADPTFTGTFDPGLSPTVQICALAGSACGSQVALFTSSTTPAVTLQARMENYQVNWATKPYNLSTTTVYRIRVRIGALELGFADLKVVASSKDLKSVGSGFVGVVKGSPLLIKFRIEDGAAELLPPAGGTVNIGADGGGIATADGGLALLFSDGALSQNTDITVAPATVFPADPSLVSPVYDLGPDGTTFGGSGVVLTLRYDPTLLPPSIPEGDLKLYTAQTGGPWVLVANSSVNALDNTVTGTITHFSQGVVGAPVETIVVSPDPASTVPGQTVQLTAELKDKQDRVLTNREVTWSSSNPAVATVDASGLVTGVTPGGATITAASEGKQGTATITVSPLAITDLLSLSGNNTCIGTPNSCVSTAYDINARGQVVGISLLMTGANHAFLWNPDTPNDTAGTMHDLGHLGGDLSIAMGINASGQVTGMSTTADGSRHVFLWTPHTPNGTTGTMIDLGSFGGLNAQPLAGINDYGQVAGQYDVDISGNTVTHAFLWTPNAPNGSSGSMIDLGTLGGNAAVASDLNASGQVVGSAANAANLGHPFLWKPTSPNGTTGAMTDLGTLGGSSASATGINAMGQVVGASNDPLDETDYAFVWTPATPNGITGTMSSLGTLGGTSSRAFAISASGQVVGFSLLTGDSGRHAFLWTPAAPNGATGTMIDLGTLGGASSAANAINASQVVGSSERPGRTNIFGATLWTIR